MGKEIIINDINDLLERINYQFEVIKNHKNKIPRIELDLIMVNTVKLYDDLCQLARLNNNDKIGPEIVPQTQINENIPETEKVVQLVDPVKLPETEEKKTETIQQTIVSEESTKKVSTKNPDLFANADNITVADKFKDEKNSFYDKISTEKQNITFADKITQPVQDLNSGIGINDKYLFINELFGGVIKDYNDFISSVDNAASRENALEFYEQKVADLNWDSKKDAAELLKSFIKRRFI